MKNLPHHKPKSNLTNSFKTAFFGIMRTIITQRNMKIHIVVAQMVLIFGMAVPLDLATRAALLFSIALVFFAEILNTALEAIVDLYTGEYHRFALLAKDAAAGGVLVLAIATIIVFADILWLRRDIFSLHLNDLMFFASWSLPLIVSMLLVLFTNTRRHIAWWLYIICLLAIAGLATHTQDPIFTSASVIVATLACAAKITRTQFHKGGGDVD